MWSLATTLRTLTPPCDYALVHALWLLERFPPGRMPDVAAEAMAQGHDGPNVLRLASFHKPTRGEVASSVEPAFADMGRRSLTAQGAALLVCQRVASLIVQDLLDPLEGAGEIVAINSDLDFRGPPGVHAFVSILDLHEYDVEVGRRSDPRPAIVDAAWQLLGQ